MENKTVRIKIKGKNSPFHHIPLTKTHKAFFCIEDLSVSIHTDQMGAFPFTSQPGNRYIMVAIHLDTYYIFVKPMKSDDLSLDRRYSAVIGTDCRHWY